MQLMDIITFLFFGWIICTALGEGCVAFRYAPRQGVVAARPRTPRKLSRRTKVIVAFGLLIEAVLIAYLVVTFG